ncbi:MAG: hypothetical protein COA78_14650 [Blastopirellula sp.]|nr:MAG: hypothetical protein COA78_14650 [Blastopirellula sp.]
MRVCTPSCGKYFRHRHCAHRQRTRNARQLETTVSTRFLNTLFSAKVYSRDLVAFLARRPSYIWTKQKCSRKFTAFGHCIGVICHFRYCAIGVGVDHKQISYLGDDTMNRSSIESFGKAFLTLLAMVLFIAKSEAQTLTIGSISDEPSAEIRTFLPFAGYLESELSNDGIKKVKIRIARSLSEMAEFMKEGKVDLYIDSPFSALVVSKLSGSRITLRRWKEGLDKYHSVVFVKKQSDIHTIEDLKGKMIAFEEPFSSSSYLLPLMSMQDMGHSLVEKRNATMRVRHREIGYVFSNADLNTMVWVQHGKAAAGVMSTAALIKHAKDKRNQLRVIHETFDIPRHVVVFRGKISQKLDQRLQHVLSKMHQSEAGRNVLAQFDRTTKFDSIPQDFIDRLPLLTKFIEYEFDLEPVSAGIGSGP